MDTKDVIDVNIILMFIKMAHGSGGRAMLELIDGLFAPSFGMEELLDSGVFDIDGVKLAFTTDSYTVQPLFFPGGDIGKLAVTGTVNDLAVIGAEPLFLSCGLIIEEGFSEDILRRIVSSMASVCRDVGVNIITGDTKVVRKGEADGIFINTAGIGILKAERIFRTKIVPGDKVLVSGTIGDHGAAVLVAREGIESEIKSDCAPLWELVKEILEFDVKFMRDPTRGGIASTLNELVRGKDFGIEIWESEIPVFEGVKGLCELMGFDVLYMANEGKVVAVVSEKDAEKVLGKMRGNLLGKDASIIGEVTPEGGKVILRSLIGGWRIVDMPSGEQFPRIC